jgi:hypothetical protein
MQSVSGLDIFFGLILSPLTSLPLVNVCVSSAAVQAIKKAKTTQSLNDKIDRLALGLGESVDPPPNDLHCAICQDTLHGDLVRALRCAHIYHRRCLAEYIVKNEHTDKVGETHRRFLSGQCRSTFSDCRGSELIRNCWLFDCRTTPAASAKGERRATGPHSGTTHKHVDKRWGKGMRVDGDLVSNGGILAWNEGGDGVLLHRSWDMRLAGDNCTLVRCDE